MGVFLSLGFVALLAVLMFNKTVFANIPSEGIIAEESHSNTVMEIPEASETSDGPPAVTEVPSRNDNVVLGERTVDASASAEA